MTDDDTLERVLDRISERYPEADLSVGSDTRLRVEVITEVVDAVLDDFNHDPTGPVCTGRRNREHSQLEMYTMATPEDLEDEGLESYFCPVCMSEVHIPEEDDG